MATLLVDDEDRDIKYWRRELSARITDFEMRVWPDVPDPGEIDVILADGSMKRNGGFGQFPNLGWVNYLGHGVGDVLRDPSLPPHVLVTRMKSEGIARSLTGYTVHAVMSHHLRQREYALQQDAAVWRRLAVPAPDEVRIAVLGLGVCGLRIARAFDHLGYRVCGWTRSPRTPGEIASVCGREALEALLAESDYVVGVLPETSATVGLINRETLAAMKAGAYLVSAGRGSLVVEEDLLEALDSGHLSGAGAGRLPHPAATGEPRVLGTPEDRRQPAQRRSRQRRLEERVRRDRGEPSSLPRRPTIAPPRRPRQRVLTIRLPLGAYKVRSSRG